MNEFLFPASEPLERPTLYGTETLESLTKYHQKLAKEHSIANPYFDYTNQGHPLIFSKQLENGVTLKVGPIGAFTKKEIAAIIQEQTCIYIAKGTMGKKFPKDDPDTIDALTAIMMDGFSPSRVIVVFEKQTPEGVKPVVGVQASFGTIDTNLLQTMQNNNVIGNKSVTPSSLSTIQSLNFTGFTKESDLWLSKFGELSEKKVVCLSRLFSLELETSNELELNLEEYAWLAMAALAIGINGVAKLLDLIEPQICLYDTQMKLQKILNEKLGMELVIKPSEVEPKEEIPESLRYHYSSKEEGGVAGDIAVGFGAMPLYSVMALKLLAENGIEVKSD